VLSLTLALDGMGGHCHSPAALPLGKRRGTHCTGPVWTGVENITPGRV